MFSVSISDENITFIAIIILMMMEVFLNREIARGGNIRLGIKGSGCNIGDDVFDLKIAL
jgi:hypothetical protein